MLYALRGVKGFDEETFKKVHSSGEQITSIRINPQKKFEINNSPPAVRAGKFDFLPVPWSQFGYYLAKRPSFTFDPLFHAGCYYVQDASSMFLEQAIKQLVDLTQPLKVLDISAAPGGKSTHIQSLISSDSLLVSNDVIKSRSKILTDNIIKWGSQNVIVTNNDPLAFQKLPDFFDVIVVDAPCSGSGLFRKNEEAITEWSLNNVALCSQRQKKILADVMPALKENGILIYSTCSYSPEEDEEIGDWIIEHLQMENVELRIDDNWKIVESISSKTKAKGYRFYPDKLKGEGFYLACFRNKMTVKDQKIKYSKPVFVSKQEYNVISEWIDTNDFDFFKMGSNIYALKNILSDSFSKISSTLNIINAGVQVGEVVRDKLIPAHALALNCKVAGSVACTDLDYTNAITYLQKNDLKITTPSPGWQLVSYKKHNLGWINALHNRINNYYPKEMRILKQQVH